MYRIIWDEKALGELGSLEKHIAGRIIKKVKELSDNLFSKDIKRLKGSDDFRLRVGDYRIIFSIESDTITILKVGHRKNIYDSK